MWPIDQERTDWESVRLFPAGTGQFDWAGPTVSSPTVQTIWKSVSFFAAGN